MDTPPLGGPAGYLSGWVRPEPAVGSTPRNVPDCPPGLSLPLNGDAVEASDSPGDEVTVASDPALAAETDGLT